VTSDPDRGPRASARFAERLRPGRASLRVRTVVAFSLVSLILAGTLAVVAYSVVRSSLIDDRRESAMGEAYTNARAVRTRLRADGANLADVLVGLQRDSSGEVFLRLDGRWYASSLTADPAIVPATLRRGVEQGAAGNQMLTTVDGVVLATGVPIAEADASFYQLTSADDLDRTLGVLGSALAIGAFGAAIVGAFTGAVIAGRVMRPLRDISEVAHDIASGRSESRLDADTDPDLQPLAESFNGMVDELQARVQREARFASDISHDLRGPLTALSAAVSVVNRRRDQLPAEASAAVDALDEQVVAFNQLVLDLLEISRFEAGTASLQTREIDVLGLVRAVVDERTVDGDRPTIRVISADAGRAQVDPRRMHQVFTNLLDNADNYAGGVSDIVIDHRPDTAVVRIAVIDDGPGVDEDERDEIFERFHRGRVGTSAGAPRGTGLGLPLAAEHVKLHGGRLWVEADTPRGARFVVELPTDEDGSTVNGLAR
jgi:signal transduction histidine kinase